MSCNSKIFSYGTGQVQSGGVLCWPSDWEWKKNEKIVGNIWERVNVNEWKDDNA